jgi:hypothetical protein
VSEDRARQRGQGGARHVIGVLVALVLLLVVFAGLVEGTRSIKGLGYEPQAVAATTGPNIELSAFPDSYACHGSNGSPGGGPHPDWVTYCPSTSIKVPAHSTITVTIRQYDTGGSVHNPFFAVVRGTVGNVMYLNGKAVQQVNPEEIGHTFTVQTPAVRERPSARRLRHGTEHTAHRRPRIPHAERHRLQVHDGGSRTVCVALLRPLRRRPRGRRVRRPGGFWRSDGDHGLHVRNPHGELEMPRPSHATSGCGVSRSCAHLDGERRSWR